MRKIFFLIALTLFLSANDKIEVYENTEICAVFTMHPDGDIMENVKYYMNYQSALDEAIERSQEQFNYECDMNYENNDYSSLVCTNGLTTLEDIQDYSYYLEGLGIDGVENYDIFCGYMEN